MKNIIKGVLCTLLFLLSHTPAAASLIINEVDYDQPGKDYAEFIELLNSSSDSLSLDNYTISLINGASETKYDSYDLKGYTLKANSYFVICGNSSNVINCNFDTGKDSNLIQNGGTRPDAIALYFGGTLIDSISYEGNLNGYVEGFGDQLDDKPSNHFMGLSRLPSGYDSNNNNQDFQYSCITPGAANTLSNIGCSNPIPEPASLLLMLVGLLLIPKKIRALQIKGSLRTTLHHEQK